MKTIIINSFYSITYFLCILLFLSGCESENVTKTYSNVQEFKKLIGFTGEIIKVQFEITDGLVSKSFEINEVNNTNSDNPPHIIIAILKLDSLQIGRLKEQVKDEPDLKNQKLLTKEAIRSWFPKKMKESLYKEKSFFKFKNSVYDANLLIHTNSYTGFFVLLDDNMIYLSLFSNR
jgi:hypothetical protein